jgi:peroxiredoxin
MHYVVHGDIQLTGQLADSRHGVEQARLGHLRAEAPSGVKGLGIGHVATLSPRAALASPAVSASHEPVVPSSGWGVAHLVLRALPDEGTGVGIQAALRSFTDAAPHNQVRAFSVLGGRADLGLMLVAPDLHHLDIAVKGVTAGPVEVVYSYLSITEESEYRATEDDERARLVELGEADVEAKLAEWNERIAHYREMRVHPDLPVRRLLCFYPMSKRRLGDDNWYALGFDERKAMMMGHGTLGRKYAGRVTQLITGSTGLDDWEWGVTLFSDDLAALKEIVYEMRFDEVSARFGEFGPFFVGLVMDPADVLERAGLL